MPPLAPTSWSDSRARPTQSSRKAAPSSRACRSPTCTSSRYSERPGTPAAEDARPGVHAGAQGAQSDLAGTGGGEESGSSARAMVGRTLSVVTLHEPGAALSDNYLKVALARPARGQPPDRIRDRRTQPMPGLRERATSPGGFPALSTSSLRRRTPGRCPRECPWRCASPSRPAASAAATDRPRSPRLPRSDWWPG